MIGGEQSIALRVRSDLSELERVGREIEEVGRAGGAAAADISGVLLAVDEMLTNVISYAFPPGEDHWIQVRAWLEDGTFLVEIDDDGRPFDPAAAAEPSLDGAVEERSVGGLGIHIARRLVDEMAYRRQAGHNLLTLKKHFTQAGATGEAPGHVEAFRVDVTEDQGAVVLGVGGQLDTRGAQLLEERLRALLESGATRLVFDCTGLTALGSAGIRVMLIAAKESAAAGGAVALVAPPTAIAKTLEIAGLSGLLPTCATRAEALAALGGR